MVEKMPWGSRESLGNGWFVDRVSGGVWTDGRGISGGISSTYYCRACGVFFAESDMPLIFKTTSSDTYHCEPCARKVGIIW